MFQLVTLSVLAFTAAGVIFGGTVTTLTPLAQQRNMNTSTVSLKDLTFNRPRGLAVNSAGTIFVTDTSYIVSIQPSTASIVAGQLASFGFADGPATTTALLNTPSGVTIVGSTLFFSDSANHAIRALVSGSVTTIAGAPPPTPISGLADGPGTVARFNTPRCLVGDSANNVLYVCDIGNLKIRRVTTGGTVETLTTILAGNVEPSVRLVLLTNTLYIARQLENSPQSALTKTPASGATQTNFSNVPQSPAAAVVDASSTYFIVTQDNRIGVINISSGAYKDITGTPTTQTAADGRYPDTTPVFIQLVDIARTATGETYYTLEAGPSPRLRSLTVQDIEPTPVTFVVSSSPPVTNASIAATLLTLVNSEITTFLQRFGYTGSVASAGTTSAGNAFVATVPASLADATSQQARAFETAGNPVRDLLTSFNADRPIVVSFDAPLPPRTLKPSQQMTLSTAFTADLQGIVGDPRVTSAAASQNGNFLTMSASLPGSFLNASTQPKIISSNFPAMNQQLATVNAVRMFDSRIFDLSAPQLDAANQNFATDVGNIANTDNVVRAAPQVGAETTLTAGAPSYVLQPFLQFISGLQLKDFPSLFTYLQTIPKSQEVSVPISYYPTDPIEQADIVSNITARARSFAGSNNVTADVINVTGTGVTIVYRYPTTLNTLNFSNVNLTGVFAVAPPSNIIPRTVMTTSCPPVCIAVVTVVGSILLLLCLLLLLWCCCKKDRKPDDVLVPQFQPVFQPNEAAEVGDEGQRTLVGVAANPLYRTSELRESRRETSPPDMAPAEAVASTEARMSYHAMRDEVASMVVVEEATTTAVYPQYTGERFDEVMRVLHVSPRREGSKSSRLPNPLVYDSVMRRLETQDAAPGTDSVIRVVKVVTRDSPSRSIRSTSGESRSKRHVRVEMSPNPYVPELADTAAPHTLTAVESALRQL